MFEVIALFFLCRHIGQVARRKAQPPTRWILITIGAWVTAEIAGILLAASILGTDNIIGLMLIALMSAIGGYLIVKARLDKIPDSTEDDDIDRIGQ